MNKVIKLQANNPLLGKWCPCNTFDDHVIEVSLIDTKFSVRAYDSEDGEEAEVYDVSWDDDQYTLSFAAHWTSTGSFVKYKLQKEPKKNRANLIISRTWQETWERMET